MSRSLRWPCGFAVILALLIPARPSSQEAWTLGRCISHSLSRNPLWLSMDAEILAARARERQARAFAQPSLDLDSDLQPKFFDFGGSGESYIGLSQVLEFPGKRAIRGRIAGLETREIETERDLLRLDLIYQVNEAFYGVLLAEEGLKNALTDRDLARDFRSKAELKLAAGDIARVEVVRAGVEAAKAETGVQSAQNEVRLAKARLNFLMGRSRSENLAIQGMLRRPPLTVDPESLFDRASSARPEMARMDILQRREALKRRSAVLSYWPDFNIGLSRHRLTGEATTWDFTLSLAIPLFFWQPKSGPIAESEALQEALRRQAEQTLNGIRRDVDQAVSNARTAESRIRIFETEILTQAEQAYDLFAFSFQEGEIGGIELIEARRTLLEARKSYADALHQYALTLAALERAVGASLQGDPHE